MHVWYKAVCDEHQEFCGLYVDTPTRTAHLLAEHDATIYTWLELHRPCNLRLIHELEEGRDGKDFDRVIATYTDALNPTRFKHRPSCPSVNPGADGRVSWDIKACACPRQTAER